ncbi:MAG TPA: hypothetical protein VGN20_10375 [Mucilaginibacter sp.]|jgi:hypothetical protein
MNNILKILEEETEGTCYTSYRYCADAESLLPKIGYDDTQSVSVVKNRYGETDNTLKTTKNLRDFAEKIRFDEPLFKYFLDGSRRTYKIDDIEILRSIYPIMGGQIGVACCERISPAKFKCAEFESSIVLSLPTIANPQGKNAEQFFNALTNKVNQAKRFKDSLLKVTKILSYSSSRQEDAKKYEDLGIATIQDEMIDCEKRIVAGLHHRNKINPQHYLIKDGSLQYKPMKSGDYRELTKFKNYFRSVIGVSKMFNPELFKDRANKSNADVIAKLGLYHRTPAYMYRSEIVGNVNFAIWYVRIRDAKHTESPFAGVVKIEKILITDDENEQGLDSAEVDLITANIINERNPVCYGNDSRWANHLYPVYLTETYLKSRYLSDMHFLNLF